MSDSFVHLRVQTEYTMRDSVVRIPGLVDKAAEFSMPAVAITDRNLHGAIELYQEARRAGIKPIIGYQADVTLRSRTEEDAAFPILLLAENTAGYRNLVKLVSIAHVQNRDLQIDADTLASHAVGLIGLMRVTDEARHVVPDFRDIFGANNFFLELQRLGTKSPRRDLTQLRWAQGLGVGLVACNDVRFLEPEHYEAYDVLTCIKAGTQVADKGRWRSSPEAYFKSPAQMRDLFADIPEAVENALAIAGRCNVELEFAKLHHPTYVPPDGKTPAAFLREVAIEGLRRRYGAVEPEIKQRLEYELDVIEANGFGNYFLILWDIIAAARRRGIPVGPGRGTAPSSLLAYVLEITDIDPIRFGLRFERFLNPEAVSPPDIDSDVGEARRDEVIGYIRDRYGERAVAGLIMFNTFDAEPIVREVGRVLGWSEAAANRLASMIPNGFHISLQSAEKRRARIRAQLEADPAARRLWQNAKMLEGLKTSVHFMLAPVVIGDGDLTDWVPLTRAGDGATVVQYAREFLSDLGLLRLAIIPWEILTVFGDTEKLIRDEQPDFNLKQIPGDDENTLQLLSRGEVFGIRLLEDHRVIDGCRLFGVSSFQDLVAFMEITQRRCGTLVADEHPLLRPYGPETSGVLIYQEQFLAAVQDLAGFTSADADLLLRALKRAGREAVAEETRFIDECTHHRRLTRSQAKAVLTRLKKVALLACSKSHAVAYGWIAYQAAYLKANWPLEFMTASLKHTIDSERTEDLLRECRRMGIEPRHHD